MERAGGFGTGSGIDARSLADEPTAGCGAFHSRGRDAQQALIGVWSQLAPWTMRSARKSMSADWSVFSRSRLGYAGRLSRKSRTMEAAAGELCPQSVASSQLLGKKMSPVR